jgi:hypothetical protein
VTLFLSKLCSLNQGYFECDYLHASDACEALAQEAVIMKPESQVPLTEWLKQQ